MIRNTTLLCKSSLSKVPTTKTSLPFTISSWKVEPQVLLISSLQLQNCKIIQLHDCKIAKWYNCILVVYSSCWSPACNCKSTTREENLPVSKVCRPSHNDYQQSCPGTVNLQSFTVEKEIYVEILEGIWFWLQITVNLKFIWRPYGKISSSLFRECLMGFARFWLQIDLWKNLEAPEAIVISFLWHIHNLIGGEKWTHWKYWCRN